MIAKIDPPFSDFSRFVCDVHDHQRAMFTVTESACNKATSNRGSDCFLAVTTDGRQADHSSRAQTTDVVTALNIRSKVLIFAKIWRAPRADNGDF